MVPVEARILDRDERLLEPRRHRIDLHRVTAGLAEQRHQAAVAGVDIHRFLHLDVAQGLHVGQLRGDQVVQRAQRECAQQGQSGERDERPAHEAAESGHRSGFRLQVMVAVEYRGAMGFTEPGVTWHCSRGRRSRVIAFVEQGAAFFG